MVKILGKEVGSTGYGLMGLTWRTSTLPDEESFACMKEALSHGCVFWNGGEFYGPPDNNSLTLLEKYFTKYPEDVDKVILSVKVGGKTMMPDGSAENVKRAVESCTSMLTKKKIDILEMARVDPAIPIETTVKEMEKYVKAGKIGGVGLSECGAATIKRAAKVTTIAAVEVELSLFATDIFTNGIAAACKETNIPIVAYSPIGRGMLTGELKSLQDLPEQDFRRAHLPRFQPGAFEKNMELANELQVVAKNKGCTPAQLAIGWVRAQSDKGDNPPILAIPGGSSASRVKENSTKVALDKSDEDAIEKILSKGTVVGGRYGPEHDSMTNG